jgi:hypothetical protein
MNLSAESGKQKQLISPATLAASGRFGKYPGESEQIVRVPAIEKSPALVAMLSAYRNINHVPSAHESFAKCLIAVEGLDYGALDVGLFSMALAEFQGSEEFGRSAGLFLSALILLGKDRDYTIFTRHLDAELHCVGVRNEKNIRVEGNVGNSCGWQMERGIIEVKGNAGDNCGYMMQEGRIIIDGDTRTKCGQYLRSGSISVGGNAGRCLGHCMGGGRIDVSGEIESLAEIFGGGEIFHKGRMIWPEGGGKG